MKRALVGLFAVGLVIGAQCQSLCLPAFAQYSRSDMRGTFDALDSQTDTLVKTVQIFLQMRGRWYPQPKGSDMQLCYAIKDLKDQISSLQKSSRRPDQMQSQIQQLTTSASGVHGLLRQAGVDESVMTQFRMVSNSIRSLSAANMPIEPMPWNPSPGWHQPDYNPWGPTLISSTFEPPNMVRVSWSDNGRVSNYTSVLDSYILNNGRHGRPARGEETQLLSTAYQQARQQNPGFTNPINITQRGRGTFILTGQPPMMINQVQIVSPKWSPDVTVNLQTAHGPQFTMQGVLTNYTPSGFGINVQSSGIGGATASLQASTSFNRLYSLVGNGNLGGRPFSINFTQ